MVNFMEDLQSKHFFSIQLQNFSSSFFLGGELILRYFYIFLQYQCPSHVSFPLKGNGKGC